MLRAVLVDNERLALDLLHHVLAECGKIEIVGEFTKASELLKELKQLKPDVVFLDIEMPGINGLELAAGIGEIDEETEIIFVTAYDEYALDAFRVNALDYLLKPPTLELVSKTVEKLIRRKNKAFNHQTGLPDQILTFGELTVMSPDAPRPLRWVTAKVEELFAMFLLHENKWMSKWQIIEMLWPDSEKNKGEQNLYTSVFRLKKTLQDAGIKARINTNKGYYQLELNDCESDIKKLEIFLGKRPTLTEQTLEEFEKAISLYRGDLFGDRSYSWCIVDRERYHEWYCEQSKQLALYYIRNKQYRKAAGLLKTLLQIAPDDPEGKEMLANIDDR